jgi:hypothetical protein
MQHNKARKINMNNLNSTSFQSEEKYKSKQFNLIWVCNQSRTKQTIRLTIIDNFLVLRVCLGRINI